MERYTMRLPDDLGAVPVDGYGTPEIIDRLAAYEDTGLEPDSIEEAKEAVGRAAIELAYYHKAEQEGHLLVLPCKVGDTVWTLNQQGKAVQGVVQSLHQNLVADEPGGWVATVYYPLYNQDLREAHADFVPMRKYHHFDAFGKTVFLTREAAEVNLKGCDGV